MGGPPVDLDGARTLIVGASSGIGQAFAVAAHARGARVALAARRIDVLDKAAAMLDGSAHELDVSKPSTIEPVVDHVADVLGGIDVVVFTSAVVPFAHIEETDITTWVHAYTVNAVGASHVLRAALPHLSENPVIMVASSHDVGRPRAGVAAYNASKAALDEILRAWRSEHPELPIIRVSVGPTEGTEILRGADRDLLAELYRAWAHHGQIPRQMSAVSDVAETLASLVAAARRAPTVVPEIVHLAPRITRR
ncbi:SDR family oxidoreductase [Mycolicibacterium elephantis]|uniref:SDR family oxidoreductase n=1 Tax=Mycolicibacterium elephantis TaxID=81858 RepID=UPI0006296CF9|nr:SDR family oxidoreductase [Mycolicibacterium elephantis]KKW66107.1 oxidoreductase [Mycolicibacterium elephantis]